MWNAAITNAGAALLTRWAGGGTLMIDGASASTGMVDTAALLACTALSGEEHRDVQLVNTKVTDAGMRYDIQFTAVETAYTAYQVGIWAHLEGDANLTLLAIFQSDAGIAVQSIAAMPNFIYSFKATLAIDNAGEIIAVLDSGALVCWADLQEAIAGIEIEVDNRVSPESANPVSGAAVAAYAATTALYSLTIPIEGWSDAAPYSMDVEVPGILDADIPFVYPDQADAAATDEAAMDAWACITGIETGDGKITVYAENEKPQAAVPIQIRVIRGGTM